MNCHQMTRRIGIKAREIGAYDAERDAQIERFLDNDGFASSGYSGAQGWMAK